MTAQTIGKRWSTGLGGVIVSLIVPVGILVVWWFGSLNTGSPFFPSLQSILETFAETWLSEKVVTDVLPSLGRMFAGFAIAVVVGVAVGVLFGRIRILAYAFNPVLQFFRALPATALIPVSIVLLGIGDTPKILLIAFVSVFPVLLNTIDGVRNIDPVVEDVVRSYRFDKAQRVRWVQLHAASPQVLAGMRVALSMAFVVMVVTEMLAATNGIGYVTLTAQQSFQISLMWSGLLLLGLLGIIINGLFVLVERRLLRWYVQDQED
ncbi:ABC transporter permease [Microbacterium immunditiarum]|uniref:ABC-type nitrate/sulfonate/bicarbonate transport system permease component n=1 Tax=Microbacterium immunditiarum TaxID=337480 RepID=A0A7Y9GL14_9MICO|nr:ABC transporter permease [Microbacterium immunditiarum]NYE18281.1 ABC-type nitrate/sulfonate/bicarbonate transport system permease component [Microbacterium immunditiarum]